MSKSNDIEYKNVWDYLDKSGVLDNGSDIEIEQAKEEYWRIYRRLHKKHSRKKNPEIYVSFSSEEEIEEFRKEAKEHNKSLSKYIRESARAYIKQEFLHPNDEKLDLIVQELARTRIGIEHIKESIEHHPNIYKQYDLVLQAILDLEKQLDILLKRPKLLEDSIKTLIQKQPWEKERLMKLLEEI